LPLLVTTRPAKSKLETFTLEVSFGNHSKIVLVILEIPLGLKYFTLEAFSFGNHSKIWSFNPCSHAFVVKKGHFKFSSHHLLTLQDDKTLPMVLDWAIGKQTFDRSKYVCGSNSECYEPDKGSSGYRCRCKAGYEGNPYLSDGCQGTYYTSNEIPKLHNNNISIHIMSIYMSFVNEHTCIN
jgi:hypothetical protein